MNRLSTARAFVALLVAFGPAFSPAGAQTRSTSTSDPLTDVTRMYEAREPATTAAGALRRTHSRTATDAAAIMRQAGYPPGAVAGALRTEYTATLTNVYRAMREASIPPSEISRAFSDNSFSMNCLDPMGNPMPCGQFGGNEDAPVMGQLAWTPQSQGYTDSLLTITGSAMPEMWVRVGSHELQQVSATGSQLVVRLPSFPASGSLQVRRKSDGASGTLGAYSVVAAPVPWDAWGMAAANAARAEVRDWLAVAKVVQEKCLVNAPIATGVAGVLSSDHVFQKKVRSALMLQGAPSAVATAWDDAFTTAWKTWADATTLPSLPIFTALVSVPADLAPPTAPVAPPPVGGFVSSGSAALAAGNLAQSISDAIAPYSAASDARSAAVTSFAHDIGGRFTKLLLAPVTGVTGFGPVPSYASGKTPGPVVGGQCSGVNVLSAGVFMFQ